MDPLQIVEFSSTDGELLAAAKTLRAYVWNNHTGREAFPDGTWTDRHDDHAYHWGVLASNNRLVASARLCVHDELHHFPDYGDIEDLVFVPPAPPIAMMSRLVVHPANQRQGLAQRLVQLRLQKSAFLHCRSVLCEVPAARGVRYRALGFRHVGPAQDTTPLREANIAFHLYLKPLPATPATQCPPGHASLERTIKYSLA